MQELSPIGFDLRDLAVFRAVVEAGGMTEAARRLQLSQSAVSQTVARLEQRMGTVLLDRQIRPQAPTRAGNILLVNAVPLLRKAHEISYKVRNAEHCTGSHLRVALVDSLASVAGPHLIQMMQSEVARWTIWSGLSHSLGQSLLMRELDMIASFDVLEEEEGLERHDLLTESYVLALPPNTSYSPDQLADLAKSVPFVRYSSRSKTGQQIEQYLRRVGLRPPACMEFDTSHAVLSMVAAGAGWAITTPLCALQASPQEISIRFCKLPTPGIQRHLMIVAHEKELGDLPDRVASALRSIIKLKCCPAATKLWEGMAKAMFVPRNPM
jgi:DNA-binding transcriptional LysR family regulator